MSTIEPSRYICKACKDEAVHYSDGVIWCETCGRSKAADEVMDRSLSTRWAAFVRRFVPVVGRTPREQKLHETKK